MNDTARRRLLYVVTVALAGIVACVIAAAAFALSCGAADPCYAEPSPLPRVYVPLVAREVPAMSAEYTPAQPVPTVTPEVQP